MTMISVSSVSFMFLFLSFFKKKGEVKSCLCFSSPLSLLRVFLPAYSSLSSFRVCFAALSNALDKNTKHLIS